ncbi:MAG: tetratricopeptide repeat protein [Bacteroidota bacterium]
MLTKKKSISKKEIKEDTLVTSYYKFVQFFSEYKSKIYLYAGIVVAAAVAVYFYSSYNSTRNDKAELELSKVMALYDAGAYQEAINGRAAANIPGLQKIVDEYGSTESGETAKLYLANCYNMLGKFDEALKYYDSYSGDNDVFEASALAGKAGCLEAKGDFEKAASLYKEAANVSKSNALNSDYLLNSGVDYLEAGKKEAAREVLEKIKEDYKTSMASREAERYLVQVK